MAKGLQCVLALFPRNDRFSASFSGAGGQALALRRRRGWQNPEREEHYRPNPRGILSGRASQGESRGPGSARKRPRKRLYPREMRIPQKMHGKRLETGHLAQKGAKSSPQNPGFLPQVARGAAPQTRPERLQNASRRMLEKSLKNPSFRAGNGKKRAGSAGETPLIYIYI